MAKVRFDWDQDKDDKNHKKHGVTFAVAQLAFADPKRVIAEDLGHRFRRAAVHLPRGRHPHPWRGLLAERKANL